MGVPQRRRLPAPCTAERLEVLAVLCSDRFADAAPAQVWATLLLDEGTHLALRPLRGRDRPTD